jgi:hypothetical protein
MVLREIDRFTSARADFLLDTTVSGRTYVIRIDVWKRADYGVEIVHLRLNAPIGAAPN